MLETILILAGRRAGVTDPLAQSLGVDDKCCVPVAGVPMLVHVLRAALADPKRHIIVSANDANVGFPLDQWFGEQEFARLSLVASLDNLTDSVLAALDGAVFPVLITTADSCLLTDPTIAEIDGAARAAGADAAVALARKADVLSVHPDGQRRFYGFSDVEVSNCNCYWLGSTKALRATEAFRGGGQFIKKPLRVLRAFGLINLLRFRFGLGPLHIVFERLGRHMGLNLVPILVSDGAAAIDVDNSRSLLVTEQVMAANADAGERQAHAA